MNTRLVIAALWFFAAAYAGSMLNGIVGLPALIGPAVGALTAATVILDPFDRFASPARAGRPVARDVETAPTSPATAALATR